MIKYPHAQVIIETDKSLEDTAALLSQKLFCGVPFGDKHLGLFEEVPGLRLLGSFLELFVAIHGFEGSYTLLLKPKALLLPDQKTEDVDISNYVAELARSIGFKCFVPSTQR